MFKVDKDKCIGCGACVGVCDTVFDFDDDNLAFVKNQPSVDEIDMQEKSETRKAIEKFVDENPEAVALLLRNWLNDGWD